MAQFGECGIYRKRYIMSNGKNISKRDIEQARRKAELDAYNLCSVKSNTESFRSKMSRVRIGFATTAFVITTIICVVGVWFVNVEHNISIEKTVSLLKPIIKLLLLFSG
jgi:hypothetical protein